MTRIFNAETGFKDELLEGLTSAYGRYLRRVPGASAVMSVDAPIPGQVSVIIGGGSGHYPAFAGLVGPGLCHGAVVGEVFTSPSAAQAYRAITALDGGAGVLLSFGNYSGDVMHFGLAAEQARAAGIDTRIVLVTDDVVSAPVERIGDRRGIAGTFFVFRAASAAARGGADLATVERIAQLTNGRTRSFGVAFAGCTFPGRTEPLFRVEPGAIAIGLGIHGEPGIDTVDWMPAEALAELLLARLLVERPPGATRARVLVNGLGSTKYEEMFVLYRSLHRLLEQAGVEVVDPEVGEFVTSLDMAGCSLTLCWLTEELEPLLGTPAATPGYRTGGGTWVVNPPPAAPMATPAPVVATDPSAAAQAVVAALDAAQAAITAAATELGRLDAVAGDGDHGVGMVRGLTAAAAASRTGATASGALIAAGNAFSDAAGGASGALWGAALLALGRMLGNANPPDAPDPCPDAAAVADALTEARDVVMRLGGARVGDKTMVDTLAPFVAAFRASTASAASVAFRDALPTAESAAQATAAMSGRKGRAATHGDHSVGTIDPGAYSLALALRAIAAALDTQPDTRHDPQEATR